MTWGADVLIRRLFIVAAVAALSGCAIDGQKAPDLSGPSEFSQSLAITATPDIIAPDAAAAINVTAFDSGGSALPGVSLRYRLITNFGTLSGTTGTTDGAGHSAVTYTAPSSGGSVDQLVTIEVTPIGANAQNLRGRTVAVRVRS
jgi:hypothetical protein